MKMRAWLLGLVAAAALASPAHAQLPNLNAYQFPFAVWKGFAPADVECGRAIGVNLAVTTDTAVPISVPTSTYVISSIWASNANVSLTSASGGVYTGTSKGGTTLAANQALSTLTAPAANAAGGAVALTLAVGATTGLLNVKTVYVTMTTAQAGATADFRLFCHPMY